MDEDAALAEEWGGPLKRTFLLAMSTPMLVLPLERIFNPAVRNNRGVADDSALNQVGENAREVLGEGPRFGSAPFFEEGVWAFVDAVPIFSVSSNWPSDVLDQLGTEGAKAAVSAADAATAMDCIRNALAHGGVSYLDRNGRHNDAPTAVLGFVSFPSGKRREELRLMRISVDGFQRFLAKWSAWLTESGVQAQLDQEGLGWFTEEPEPGQAGNRAPSPA